MTLRLCPCLRVYEFKCKRCAAMWLIFQGKLRHDFLNTKYVIYGFPLQMASYFGYTVAVSDVNNDG